MAYSKPTKDYLKKIVVKKAINGCEILMEKDDWKRAAKKFQEITEILWAVCIKEESGSGPEQSRDQVTGIDSSRNHGCEGFCGGCTQREAMPAI